jgi:integrase
VLGLPWDAAKMISEMMGHSSVTVTLDTYSHVVQGL